MITDKDVKKIADLSRIHLGQDEIDRLTKDLESILNYMNKLEKLDITKVEPTSQPNSVTLREFFDGYAARRRRIEGSHPGRERRWVNGYFLHARIATRRTA